MPLIESLGIESVMVENPYENYESPNSIVDPAIFDKYVEKSAQTDGKSLGIESVMVEDPYENYESPNSIVDPAIFDKYVEKSAQTDGKSYIS